MCVSAVGVGPAYLAVAKRKAEGLYTLLGGREKFLKRGRRPTQPS